MSKGKAKMADREKSASSKFHSNSGGAHEAGYPFVHFQPEAFRHSAKYVQNGAGLVCSVCKREV